MSANEIKVELYARLAEEPDVASPEVLSLLEEWWLQARTQFRSKMEYWKAPRISKISWERPCLSFSIIRHPSSWDRIQRWVYDFDTNEARLLGDNGVIKNRRYEKVHVDRDARRLVKALVFKNRHPCVSEKSGKITVWVTRHRNTMAISGQLPQRTARGRQLRLKEAVIDLMKRQRRFRRIREGESKGSLIYFRRGG